MVRKEVAAFAEIMERKLRLNDWRVGWKDSSLEFLFGRLRQEIPELNHTIGYGSLEEIGEEAADVANFAMMIADVARALDDGTAAARPESNPESKTEPQPAPKLSIDDAFQEIHDLLFWEAEASPAAVVDAVRSLAKEVWSTQSSQPEEEVKR